MVDELEEFDRQFDFSEIGSMDDECEAIAFNVRNSISKIILKTLVLLLGPILGVMLTVEGIL